MSNLPKLRDYIDREHPVLDIYLDCDGLLVSALSGHRKIPMFAARFVQDEAATWIPNAHLEITQPWRQA